MNKPDFCRDCDTYSYKSQGSLASYPIEVVRYQDCLGKRARNNGIRHLRQRPDCLRNRVSQELVVKTNRVRYLELGNDVPVSL
jgi:hypothetical protein